MRRLASALLAITVSGCTSTPYGIRVENVQADSVRPLLRWAAFSGEFQNVRYEVKVLSAEGKLVYRRDGLGEIEHRVEVDLESDREYHWSVRAWFELDGQRRVGPWSRLLGRTDPARPVYLPEPLASFPRFRTPAAAPERRVTP